MKSSSIKSRATCAALALFLGALQNHSACAQAENPRPYAQEAAATKGDDEIVSMSDFVVQTPADDGYKASNALSGTRFRVELMELPKAVEVVTAKFIEDIGAFNLYDALAYATSVNNATPNSDNPAGGSFTIRSFGTTAKYVNGYKNGSYIDTAFIDRIEIIRGPSSVFTGSIEPGGTMNFITKGPSKTPVTELKLRYGSFDRFREEASTAGPVNASKSVTYRFVQSYENFGLPIDFAGWKRYMWGASVRWDISKRDSLEIWNQYIHNDAKPGNRYLLLPNIINANSTYIRPRSEHFNRFGSSAFSDLRQLTSTADYIHTFNDRWSLRLGTGYSYQGLRRKVASGIVVTTNATTGLRTLGSLPTYEPNAGSYTINPALYVLGKMNYWGLEHRVIAGADYNYNNARNDVYSAISSKASSFLINIDDPDNNVNYGKFPDDYLPSSRRRTINRGTGTSLSNVFSVWNRRVTLVQGIRYNTFKSSILILPAGTSTLTTRASLRDNAPAQNYGVSVRVVPGVSAFATYGESFNPQVATNYDFQGNIFPPIRGKGWDYGVKYDLIKGRLSGSIVGFDIKQSNTVIPDLDHVGFNKAGGGTDAEGVEFGLQARPASFWQIVGSYTNMSNRITTSTRATDIGLRSMDSPDEQASLWNRFQVTAPALKGLSFGIGVIHVGNRRGNASAVSAAVADIPNMQLPSYTKVDMTIGYSRKISANVWTFGFQASNVEDMTYLVSSGAYGEPRVFSGTVGVRF